MAIAKVKSVAALALALTVFAGVGGIVYRALAVESGAAPPVAAPNAKLPADKPADKPKDDKEAIQGVWRISSIELEGKEAPDTDIWKGTRAARYVISADTFTIQLKGQPDLVHRYKLDPSKNPKEIDYLPDDDKGETDRGIYSLDGDVLKICTPVRPETARPTELKTREIKRNETGRTAIRTYKREAAEPAPADGPTRPGNGEEKEQKLLKDWCDAAKKAFELREEEFVAGKIPAEAFIGAAHRLLAAERERSATKADRVAACQAHLDRITDFMKIVKAKKEAGRLADPPAAAKDAEYYRLEAEILLEREKAK